MDNIFSSVINDDCIAGNLISPISDHHAQFLIIPNYTITQNSKKGIYKQNFKHFSSKKFITDLEKVNWDNILRAKNIDSKEIYHLEFKRHKKLKVPQNIFQ